MKNVWFVFNHDEREYSVYPELEDGSLKQENIEPYQKVAQVDFTIWKAVDIDAALEAAERMNEFRQYQKVPDTLDRYLSYGMGKYFVRAGNR